MVRSTDDFLRRYPPPSQIQESMTAPISASDKPGIPDGAMIQESYASLPSPPTRPAPAVPRPSHSGLIESDDEDHYLRAKMVKAASTVGSRKAVGLVNPHNWCYANSLLQCLFASPGFGNELSSGSLITTYKVPMKAGEKISQPQLLSKIVSNMFHWMQNGKFDTMKAKTLMVGVISFDSDMELTLNRTIVVTSTVGRLDRTMRLGVTTSKMPKSSSASCWTILTMRRIYNGTRQANRRNHLISLAS